MKSNHYKDSLWRIKKRKGAELMGGKLHKYRCFCLLTLHFSGKGLGLRVLIMGLLGPSIDELRKQEIKGRFKMGTVLRIGFHALQVKLPFKIHIFSQWIFKAVAFVHCSYFVHRDIKPSNFAIGVNNSRRIYLFDFGLSRALKKRGDMELRTMREDVSFRGTSGYCSLNGIF